MQFTRFFGAATLAGAAALFLVVTPACSSGPSNEEACSKFESLCKAAGGDGGASASVTITCKPDGFDQISNGDEVKECIDGAADCSAAVACYAKAKQ